MCDEEAPGVSLSCLPNLSMCSSHTYDFCFTIPTHFLHQQSMIGGGRAAGGGDHDIGGGGVSSSQEE